MIERTVVLPVEPDELWEALTDPEEVAVWFGGDVVWELEPGGRVHALDDEGDEREGCVEEIETGRRLRFSWWPVGDRSLASEVTYTVEPDAEGSLLTVRERPRFSLDANVNANANVVPLVMRAGSVALDTWTAWDTRVALLAGRLARCSVWC